MLRTYQIYIDTVYIILVNRFRQLYGITGIALDWFVSYLEDRYQTVVIDQHRSKPVRLKYGVPQGSVLGPKMYCMYTKPLGSIVRDHGLSHQFYADDAQLYDSFSPRIPVAQQTTLESLELCLSDSGSWLTDNKLSRNDDKTEVALFASPSVSRSLDYVSLKVGDLAINSVACVRNLGVMFDKTMSMEAQVNAVCRSAYAQLRNIGLIRRYLTTAAARTLVCGLVTSRLDYCNSLLYGIPKHLMGKLQRVQNTAARIVTGTRRWEHISPILRELHWLPVEHRVTYKILTYAYKCLNNMAPGYMTSLVNPYRPTRALRSVSETRLVIPRTRTRYGERSFAHSAAVLWNALPTDIREARSLSSFQGMLKTHLFRM